MLITYDRIAKHADPQLKEPPVTKETAADYYPLAALQAMPRPEVEQIAAWATSFSFSHLAAALAVASSPASKSTLGHTGHVALTQQDKRCLNHALPHPCWQRPSGAVIEGVAQLALDSSYLRSTR